MIKKLIFIENEHHALEYLKNKEKFRDFVPITFNFLAEQMLLKNGVKCKLEEEYEKSGQFKGIYGSSVKCTKKIIEELNTKHKGVDLAPCFFYNIYFLISSSKTTLILFKEIIKKENPEEIIVFESNGRPFEMEFAGRILQNVFKGKIRKIRYKFIKKKKSKKEVLIDGFMFLQQNFTRLFLKMKRKEGKIFIRGGEQYFKKLSELLIKRRGEKIIDFGDSIGKSFLIYKKVVPFYIFKGIKDKKFIFKTKPLIEKLGGISLPKKTGLEKELENRVKIFLRQLIEEEFTNASNKINELIYIIKKDKIKLFLNDDDLEPFGQILSRVSSLFNIKSLVFQHGLFFNLAGFNDFGENSVSDYAFVYAEEDFKRGFSKEKISKGKVKIIGNLRYDFLTNTYKKNTKKIVYAMDVTSGNKLLTPEVQFTKKKHKIILRRLFRVLKKFPEYKLIIKTKVNWDMQDLPATVAKEENFTNFEVIIKTDNNELVNNCDIFIVTRTTMGLEALLINKPVISVSFKEYDQINPFTTIKGVDTTYDDDQLEKAIRKSLKQTKVKTGEEKASLAKHIVFDGKASQKSFDFINKLLDK